jgi:hypothetical protein
MCVLEDLVAIAALQQGADANLLHLERAGKIKRTTTKTPCSVPAML